MQSNHELRQNNSAQKTDRSRFVDNTKFGSKVENDKRKNVKRGKKSDEGISTEDASESAEFKNGTSIQNGLNDNDISNSSLKVNDTYLNKNKKSKNLKNKRMNQDADTDETDSETSGDDDDPRSIQKAPNERPDPEDRIPDGAIGPLELGASITKLFDIKQELADTIPNRVSITPWQYLDMSLNSDTPYFSNSVDVNAFTLSSYYNFHNSIPTLVSYQTVRNEALTFSDIIMRDSLTTLPMVAQSNELFGVGVMTVRSSFNSSPLGSSSTLKNPNDDTTAKGVLNVVTTSNLKMDSFQRDIDVLLARLGNMLIAFKNYNHSILMLPRKIEQSILRNVNPAFERLSRAKLWEGDNPHPAYLSLISQDKPLIDRLIACFRDHPFVIAELEVENRPNARTKMLSTIACVTDQWTSAIFTNNYQEMLQSAYPARTISAILSSIILPYQQVQVKVPLDEVLYHFKNPTLAEWHVMFYRLITTRSLTTSMLNMLVNVYSQSGLVSFANIENWMIRSIQPMNIVDRQIDESFNEIISYNGSDFSATQMVIHETFAHIFSPSLIIRSSPNLRALPLEILKLLSWPIMYPRLSRMMLLQIGTQLMIYLRNIFKIESWKRFTDAYGWYSFYDPANGGVWRKTDISRPLVTFDQSAENLMPSIFILPGQRRIIELPLWEIYSNIYDILFGIDGALTLTPIDLREKQNADLPFASDDYIANSSWPLLEVDGSIVEDPEAKIPRLFKRAVQVMMKIYAYQQKNETIIAIGSRSWMDSFQKGLELASDDMSIAIQNSACILQRVLMNQPFFLWDPTTLTTQQRTIPPSIAIAPSIPNRNRETTPKPLLLQRIPITYDLGLGLFSLLSITGINPRNIDGRSRATGYSTLSNDKPLKPPVAPIYPWVVMSSFYNLIKDSSKYGVAFHLLSALYHPEDPDNIVRQLARALNPIIKASSFDRVLEFIFKNLDITLEDFAQRFSSSPQAIDKRHLSRRLMFIDSITLMERNDINIANTWFSGPLTFVSPHDTRLMSILSTLYLEDDSPFIDVVQGFYLGRVFVEDIQPFQENDVYNTTFPRRFYAYDRPNLFNQVEIRTMNIGGAYQKALSLINDAGERFSYTSPYDPELRGVMIVLNYPSAINLDPHLLDFVSKAIAIGHIAVYIEKAQVQYTVMDATTKTRDISEIMTPEDIFSILQSADGNRFNFRFVDTTYAINVQMNVPITTLFIQWVGLSSDPKDTVLISNVADYRGPFMKQKPFDYRNWSYGTRGPDGTMYMPGAPTVKKVDAKIINMNNTLPVVLSTFIDSPVQFDTPIADLGLRLDPQFTKQI